MFSGILNMAGPYIAFDTRIQFQWHGRENSEGQMTYGNDNFGWIKFLGDGEIEGIISVYGEAEAPRDSSK